MAETVKKSRIVSETDENLEESLLEEFNTRLKNCMSRDNLQSKTEDEIDSESHIYENVEVIKTNGVTSTINHQINIKSYNDSSSQKFLEAEREHNNLITSKVTTNGHQENEKPSDVDNFENLELETCSLNKSICKSTKTDSDLDQSICETDAEVRPESNLHKPSLNLPTTCLIDTSDSFETENPELKSVKDRMFLSTDDASCLLFTQTVTSPMLTPSEENIDFLKGFRRESATQNTLSDSTNASNSPKSESKEDENNVAEGVSTEIEENAGMSKEDSALITDKAIDKIAYENVEFLKENVHKNITNVEENLWNINEAPLIQLIENVKQVEELPIDSPKKNKDVKKETSKFIEIETYFRQNEQSFETENQEVITKLEECEENENDEQKLTNNCGAKAINDCDIQVVCNDNVKALKTHFMKNENVEPLKSPRLETNDELDELKSLNIMKQINKFENTSTSTTVSRSQETTNICSNISVSTVTESRFVETTTEMRATGEINNSKKKKSKKSKNQHEKENISVKSSFSKFDALQKKNVLNSQSEDNADTSNCKKCGRPVFQMERVIAERCVWHRNCFRCTECSKQLLVDTFESHEGTLYCKPHFKALFAPKAVEDDTPSKPRKHELIIRENQPAELPPGVVRASDKPDLGLEELHSLNVKERFQVFENAKTSTDNHMEKNTVKMERSPSILSKLARFQAKGMNVGVTDDTLNGVPIEISDSEEEEEEECVEGEDADLIRAKRVQREKPFHFSQMSDVKSKWEQGNQTRRDDIREERKQEIQNIRSRLFLGKQGKMKEAYQQAIAESESCTNLKKEIPLEAADTRSIKDKFEKGEIINNDLKHKESEDMSVFESGISKQSRTIFQELDASGGQPPKMSPSSPPKLGNAVRSAREAYLAKQASEDTIRSSDQLDEFTVRTADIQDRFKFFETYKEPQQKRKEFRMTPPREGQTKSKTPERELYIDPNIVRADDYVEDSVVAKTTHTATKMLNKFRQMEENLSKGQEAQGLKPLKRFTPPREPARREVSSEEESGSEEESEEEFNQRKLPERDLLEAQQAARAKQLRAKFERWEESETEVRRDSSVNIAEEIGDEQSQIETTRSLRAKFESLRETPNSQKQNTRVKVNRFVEVVSQAVTCESCCGRVYPLEMISVHGRVFHKNCFRCKECNTVLRMDSYSYNQGLLYCVTHFKRLFISQGNYDTAFGLERRKEKWNITTVA